MAFKDFLNSLKTITPCSDTVTYSGLSDDALELYDCLTVDLDVAEKRGAKHRVSAFWLARLLGLGIKRASGAFDELSLGGFVREWEDYIEILKIEGYPYSSRLSKKACHISWMKQNFPAYMDDLPKAVGDTLYSHRRSFTKVFLDNPFWLYECALALLEYTQAIKMAKSSRWFGFASNVKQEVDERFGDFSVAYNKYIMLFDEQLCPDEWGNLIVDKFSYPLEPELNGAVESFYDMALHGDICPDRKPLDLRKPIVSRQVFSEFERELERYKSIHRQIVEHVPPTLEGIDEYIGVSARILEYIDKHVETVFKVCGGTPYETMQSEILSYLQDWQYFDEKTQAKVAKMIKEVATPCLKKHFSKLVSPHIMRADASLSVMNELFGGEEA